MKRLFAVILVAALTGCGNKEEKTIQRSDSAAVVNIAGDSAAITTPKPALSVADSAKRLQERDTAAKMIENAPASVSIHLDSIPEQK